MRIIAGAFRGRHLAEVGKGDRAAHLRPTTDRVRESLFSHLTGGHYDDPVSGARVLDLFAGTGALGLEALSRGADFACFIDSGRMALTLIDKNIALCRAGDQTRVMRADASRLPENPDAPYDLIFLDPPYGMSLGERALASARRAGWIRDGALIVWEENAPPVIPEFLSLLGQRSYGGTVISVCRA